MGDLGVRLGRLHKTMETLWLFRVVLGTFGRSLALYVLLALGVTLLGSVLWAQEAKLSLSLA